MTPQPTAEDREKARRIVDQIDDCSHPLEPYDIVAEALATTRQAAEEGQRERIGRELQEMTWNTFADPDAKAQGIEKILRSVGIWDQWAETIRTGRYQSIIDEYVAKETERCAKVVENAIPTGHREWDFKAIASAIRATGGGSK